MESATIALIIPVHNRIEYTAKCLDSIFKQSYDNFFVIVVDDGSTDGTNEMIKSNFKLVEVIEGNGNLFWTASVNLGLRKAYANGAQYFMTLNNDTVAPEDFLDNMLQWAKKYPRSIIGALELDINKNIPIYGGERISWTWKNSLSLLHILPKAKQVGMHEVSYLPGRGLLIPRVVFDSIGFFDEVSFPHYYADFEFTYRATKHKYKNFINYDAKLYTYPEESGDTKNRKVKSIKGYINHLFDIKGGGNLKNFTIFSLRHCPKINLPVYLITGYIRRLLGYWIK